MFNKKLCPKCKTGKETYEKDPNSPICPYLPTYTKKSCPYFVKETERKYAKIKEIIKWLRAR